ncbi:hypothetical protein ACFL27_22755 [candidate division CSSED10-310 bacterium]|uniref:Uncharacterized protein n=1 Tax=candidate division CSSED10-310 bacterium TaxID=2855610 RepID=A0ABV6Z3K4_UNCC1
MDHNTTKPDDYLSLRWITQKKWVLLLSSMVFILVAFIAQMTLKEWFWGYTMDFTRTEFKPAVGIPLIFKYESKICLSGNNSIILSFDSPPPCMSWDIQLWSRFGNLEESFSSNDISMKGTQWHICLGSHQVCDNWLRTTYRGRGWVILRMFGPKEDVHNFPQLRFHYLKSKLP